MELRIEHIVGLNPMDGRIWRRRWSCDPWVEARYAKYADDEESLARVASATSTRVPVAPSPFSGARIAPKVEPRIPYWKQPLRTPPVPVPEAQAVAPSSTPEAPLETAQSEPAPAASALDPNLPQSCPGTRAAAIPEGHLYDLFAQPIDCSTASIAAPKKAGSKQPKKESRKPSNAKPPAINIDPPLWFEVPTFPVTAVKPTSILHQVNRAVDLLPLREEAARDYLRSLPGTEEIDGTRFVYGKLVYASYEQIAVALDIFKTAAVHSVHGLAHLHFLEIVKPGSGPGHPSQIRVHSDGAMERIKDKSNCTHYRHQGKLRTPCRLIGS